MKSAKAIGRLEVLKGVSRSASSAATFVAIMRPMSGSGKSTLIRSHQRDRNLDIGAIVVVDGMDVGESAQEEEPAPILPANRRAWCSSNSTTGVTASGRVRNVDAGAVLELSG
jgi:ABC-type polar amino acid transport system ATPase subunit